ncbi:hypothetical protein ACH3XX_45395, partial [Streptomyces scabiei]
GVVTASLPRGPFSHARDRTRTSVQMITRAAHLERNPVSHNALKALQYWHTILGGFLAGTGLALDRPN